MALTLDGSVGLTSGSPKVGALDRPRQRFRGHIARGIERAIAAPQVCFTGGAGRQSAKIGCR